MATYQYLIDQVLWYLDRRDAAAQIAGWVSIVETELAETLRARCMLTYATQALDAAYITLPTDFCTMESIRDNSTGELLVLKDSWSGSWSEVTGCTAYRMQGDCVEFLPHPQIPDPPDPDWQPQVVRMGWYAKPKPLILPSDTNAVLEQLYAVYLYGILSHATLAEQEEAMAPQWDAKYQQAVTRANTWKQQSDYSGAPYTEELSGVF